MAHLVLRCLGTFHATLDDQPLTDLESSKVRALLIYLAIESAEPHSREELIGLLWPDRPEAAARANLRQAIANLRHALGDRSTEAPFLIVSGDTVQFNRHSDYWLDVTALEAELQACAQHAHTHSKICRECIQHLQTAADLYRGEFLTQFYQGGLPFEEWTLLKRERWHHRALDVLARLTNYYERRFAYNLAGDYATRQLELDPWREDAHRQVMRALALSGQRNAALAQYEKCRRILARELEVEPEVATKELCERIKSGQLTANTDPLPNPIERVRLIGRERELAEIDQLLSKPDCRVITLAGLGGVGKTQLALHAAAAQLGAYTDGVHIVSLAELDSAADLPITLAAALGLNVEAGLDPQSQLTRYLARREMLIVLDNFEQLLEAGAQGLASLVAAAPQVTFLITSRERLNLRDEWVIEVRGLRVPSDDRVADIHAYSATQLFLDHMERLNGPRALSEADWSHVAHICRITAGLPLAIELAAARTRHWSVAEIAAELAHDLDFAAAAWPDLPPRHHSLRVVFDQSWRLLTPIERTHLQALAVFQGGFDRAAAEQVAGASASDVAALLDKSLLQTIDDQWLEMPEVIRRYAEEQLQASRDSAHIHARHSAYFRYQLRQARVEFEDATRYSASMTSARPADTRAAHSQSW